MESGRKYSGGCTIYVDNKVRYLMLSEVNALEKDNTRSRINIIQLKDKCESQKPTVAYPIKTVISFRSREILEYHA